MTSPLSFLEKSRPDRGDGAPSRTASSPFASEIDAFLHQQRQEIEQWSQTAGEAVRAEIERAVLQGLSDAFRRLADDLPRILASSAPAAPALRLAPAGDEEPIERAPPEATVECLSQTAVELPCAPAPPSIPEDARGRFRQGRRTARAGDIRQAVTHYTEALRLHPAYLEAYLVRGQAYCDLGDLDRAGADFEAAAQLAPHLAAAYLLLGGVRLAQLQWDDAVAAYTFALRLDPAQPVAFLNRGLAYAKKGDAGLAVADADEALRLNPDMAEAYYLRAVACTRQRKNDQAVADLTRLIEKDPTLWRAYYTRGLAHANEGDYGEAVADFGQVLRLAPGFLAARFQRGVAYRLKGEPTYAILEFTRYLQERPGSVRALFQRALAHLGDGQYDEALADFDRAIERNPNDQEARARREQAVHERDQARAAAKPASPSESTGGNASEPLPLVPVVETPLAVEAALDALWMTCPVCGATAPIRWKRLNRKFQCRGCSRLYQVNAEGQFTEINPDGSRRRSPRPLKRILAAAVGLCLVVLVVGWFFLRQQGPMETPLPLDLKARAELWGKAWVTNDRYMMRRLTDPTCDRALYPWLLRHQPPRIVDASRKKDVEPDPQIDARVDHAGDHAAVLLVQVKSRSLKAPVEVRQNWVERGNAWYFVPS
jgi:tetratricopeptide (TPR) repeat protein